MTYRVGNHQPQNVYRGDQYIGVMFDPVDAALAVEALNSHHAVSELEGHGYDVVLVPVTTGPVHRASSPGGDGLGYGPCVECGELWPCRASR